MSNSRPLSANDWEPSQMVDGSPFPKLLFLQGRLQGKAGVDVSSKQIHLAGG